MPGPTHMQLRTTAKTIASEEIDGLPMLRAITFDAFGTIIDTGRDVLIRVAAAACRDLRPSLAAASLLETWDRYFFSADPEPFRNLEDTTERSLAHAFLDHGIVAEPRPYVDMLKGLWMQSKAYPETRSALKRIESLPRAVVSNADDAFLREIIERNNLRFDVVVTSEGVRAYKPRPKIFEVALDALGIDPEEAVHVGDSLAADVGGARSLGMGAVWVNRSNLPRKPGDPAPDFEIPDLSTIPEIVARLREKDGAAKGAMSFHQKYVRPR